MKDLNFEVNFDSLKAYYNTPIGNKIEFDEQFFKTRKLEKNNSYDACLICTKYSRYISRDNYIKTNWAKYESEKSIHLNESISSEEVIGFIEYHASTPIGFIEGYPIEIASKYGFVVDDSEKACMITCLHIREEAKGYGLSKKLILKFLDEAREKGFKSVQVIAYQDNMNWQPIGLYKKVKFIEQRKIGDASLMTIVL